MDTSSGTTFGNTATYSCDGGHILVGPNTRTCEANGNWSPDAPICLGELVHVDNSYYMQLYIDLVALFILS